MSVWYTAVPASLSAVVYQQPLLLGRSALVRADFNVGALGVSYTVTIMRDSTGVSHAVDNVLGDDILHNVYVSSASNIVTMQVANQEGAVLKVYVRDMLDTGAAKCVFI